MGAIALSRQFADWGIGFDLDDAPPDVHSAARCAIVDTLGVIVAGSAHPQVDAMATVPGRPAGRCSTVGGRRSDPQTAATLNGMASHVWDFDDTSYTGIMHGSAVVFPAALAVAEGVGATEREMIAAFIAGSEVTYALADICTHKHYFKGWWSTATFGLVGASVAAARLLKLGPSATASAVGFAAAAAGGSKSVFGTDAKAFLVGETACRAISFAQAAKHGLSGPVGAFEDSRGFLSLLNDGLANRREAETLGRRWRLVEPGLLFKTSPVCSAAHAAIDLMASLMSECGADADDIKSIEAEVPELVNTSLIYPMPTTPQEAQFSLPYALACAACHGRVRFADLDRKEVTAEAKKRLMEKVDVTVSEDLSTEQNRRRFPESARLTLTLRNGTKFTGFCGEAYGMPNRPLSESDLLQKFASCLSFAGIPLPDIDLKTVDLLDLSAKVLGGEHVRH